MTAQNQITPELIEKAKARFWSKVDKRGLDECWPWIGHRNSAGYGVFNFKGTRIIASRASLLIEGTPIPAGCFALHHCDNPSCVNPAHLFIGSQKQNIHDMIWKGRNSSGEKHSRIMRATAARGCAHGMHTRPDRRSLGEQNGQAVLCAEDVIEIRRLARNGKRATHIAALFNCNRQTVSNIIKNVSWKHVK